MEQTEINKEKTKKIKLNFKDSKYSTGRRKKSIARIWIKKGSGNIYVNGKTLDNYFSRATHQNKIIRPVILKTILISFFSKYNQVIPWVRLYTSFSCSRKNISRATKIFVIELGKKVQKTNPIELEKIKG